MHFLSRFQGTQSWDNELSTTQLQEILILSQLAQAQLHSMSGELANEREMPAEAKREQKGLALQVQLARQSSSEDKALSDHLKRELAYEHALRETAHANSQR